MFPRLRDLLSFSLFSWLGRQQEKKWKWKRAEEGVEGLPGWLDWFIHSHSFIRSFVEWMDWMVLLDMYNSLISNLINMMMMNWRLS